MQPARQDLQSENPWPLHRLSQAAERQWAVQYHHGCHRPVDAGQSRVEHEHEIAEEDHRRACVYFWFMVRL